MILTRSLVTVPQCKSGFEVDTTGKMTRCIMPSRFSPMSAPQPLATNYHSVHSLHGNPGADVLAVPCIHSTVRKCWLQSERYIGGT